MLRKTPENIARYNLQLNFAIADSRVLLIGAIAVITVFTPYL